MAEAAAGRRVLVEEDIGPAAETGSILLARAGRKDTGRTALLGEADIGPAVAGTVPAEEDIDHAEEDTGPVEGTGRAGEDIGPEEGTGCSPGEGAAVGRRAGHIPDTT